MREEVTAELVVGGHRDQKSEDQEYNIDEL